MHTPTLQLKVKQMENRGLLFPKAIWVTAWCLKSLISCWQQKNVCMAPHYSTGWVWCAVLFPQTCPKLNNAMGAVRVVDGAQPSSMSYCPKKRITHLRARQVVYLQVSFLPCQIWAGAQRRGLLFTLQAGNKLHCGHDISRWRYIVAGVGCQNVKKYLNIKY